MKSPIEVTEICGDEEMSLNQKHSEFSRKFGHHTLTGLSVTTRLSVEDKDSGQKTESFRSVSPATGALSVTQSAQ